MLLNSVREKNQFTHLTRKVYPEDTGSLYEAYVDATEKPHGYLVLYRKIDDLLRFWTNIFPKELPPVIYAPVSDETDTVQISRSTSA